MQDRFPGNLLVASTAMPNPLYAGGVGLIVHQDDEQTIGVMLNRPLQAPPQPDSSQLQPPQIQAGTTDETDSLQNDWGDHPNDLPPEIEQEWSFDEFEGENEFNGISDFESQNVEEKRHSRWDDAQLSSTFEQSIIGDDANMPPADENAGANAEENIVDSPLGKLIQSTLPQLHFGGPVSGPVVALHQLRDFAEMETANGIYVAAQRDHLEQLIQNSEDNCRLIVGHLRWEADRLQDEINAGWWHLIPATAELVFSPAAGMWHRVVRPATSRSLAQWTGAVLPYQPLLN